MVRSMGFRNACEFPSLSAEAMVVNKSITDCGGGSAWAEMATAIAINRTRLAVLSAITRIDADVALGEIASPKAGRPFAFASNHEMDVALRRIQLLFQHVLGEPHRETATAYSDPLHRDIHFVRFEN